MGETGNSVISVLQELIDSWSEKTGPSILPVSELLNEVVAREMLRKHQSVNLFQASPLLMKFSLTSCCYFHYPPRACASYISAVPSDKLSSIESG